MAELLRPVAVVALAAAGVLASTAAPAAVEDRTWCRSTSEHFDLVTDLGKRKTASLFASLDRFRAAASALLPGRPPDRPAPLQVLVFKRSRDFATLFGFPRISGFMRPSLNQSLLAFGPDRNGLRLHAIAFHEYTHYLLRSRATLNLPAWYEEGLASYLATLEVDDEGVVTVGRGPYALLRFMVKQPLIPIEQVIGERFRLDWQRHDLSNVYSLAWGMVRFLHHARRPDGSHYAENLGAMLAAIDQGAASADALRATLDIAPEDLPGLLRRYFDARDDEPQTVFKFKIDYYQPALFQRACLEAVDKRLVLAKAVAPHRPQQAMAFYDWILERDPRHVGALIGRSQAVGDPALALQAAKSAYEIDPNAPAANVRMAQLIVEACSAAESGDCADRWAQAATFFHRALALADNRADAAYGLGMLYLYGGAPVEALDYLRRAHLGAPWSPRINFYLGEAYRLAGDATRARAHLEKTAYWHPDADWRKRAHSALDKLPAR